MGIKWYVRNVKFLQPIKIDKVNFKVGEVINPRKYNWATEFMEYLDKQLILKINWYSKTNLERRNK